MARYQRQLGRSVFFLTGTDEHGDKIVKAAEKEALTPAEFATRNSNLFRQTWRELHITNDDFIRTTEERHKKTVQLILQKIYDKGDIYTSEYQGNYCFGCERYLTEKELTPEGNCPDHLKPPEPISETNYFFRMQKYLPALKQHIETNHDFIYPAGYRNEALGAIDELIKQGEDLSISRPKKRLSWGIDMPFDSEFVTYVWFDALLNYLTATGYPDGEGYRVFWPNAIHMIAKDILKPHAIFWPTMLMAAEVPLYRQLVVHGYWLGMGDLKMSKSLGNALDPVALAAKIGEDALRYFLMREMHFGSDARFTEETLQNRLNTDLANDFGNLLQRTLSMLKKYQAGPRNLPLHECASGINELLPEMARRYHEAFAKFQFHAAIEALFELSRLLNKLVEEYSPWKMAKEEPAMVAPFLNTILRGIVVLLCYFRPIMPEKSGTYLGLLAANTVPAFPVNLSEISLAETALENWPVFFNRIDLALEVA